MARCFCVNAVLANVPNNERPIPMTWLRTLFLFAIVLLPCSALSVSAEDAPIDVEIFYSKDDPHLAEAEKRIAAVNKRFPRLRITRISYDDDAGFKKLKARETDLGLKESGDLVILLGPIPLISKGDQRNAENHFESVVERAINPNAGKGRMETKPLDYARSVLGNDAETVAFGELDGGEVKFFKAMKGGKLAGYEVDAYIPIRCPMCNDTQFEFVTDVDFNIKAIRPVRAIELYGTQLSAKRTEAFLKQFIGRTPTATPVEVDGIAGATKTVHSYENAVITILNELKERASK